MKAVTTALALVALCNAAAVPNDDAHRTRHISITGPTTVHDYTVLNYDPESTGTHYDIAHGGHTIDVHQNGDGVSFHSLKPRATPAAGCCFNINASGGPGGPVGQLGDGQNRIGQSGLPQGKYCIDSNGGLTDANGSGCILTPPTTQWQCNAGAAPTPGFSISCNGTITYKGSDTFYSCPTGDRGAWNIYSQSVKGQDKCIPIRLVADSCHSGCASTTSSRSSTKSTSTTNSTTTSTAKTTKTSTSITTVCSTPLPKTVTSTFCSTMTVSTPVPPPAPKTLSSSTPPAPKATCPANLIGTNFEFPHLIVPIDSKQPSKAFGNSLNGVAGGSVSSIFHFDIPASDAGKTCTLKFILPAEGTMETSSYKYSGNGTMEFALLASPATKDTTYANAPAVKHYLNSFNLMPGNAYNVGSHPCAAGQTVAFWMYATGSTKLGYFQDFNPCPVGLYLTVA